MEGGCGAYAEPAEGVVDESERVLIVHVDLRHRRDWPRQPAVLHHRIPNLPRTIAAVSKSDPDTPELRARGKECRERILDTARRLCRSDQDKERMLPLTWDGALRTLRTGPGVPSCVHTF